MNYLNILNKLSYSQNLSTDEARYALNHIGDIDDPTDIDASRGYYFLALTFGLMAKGLSPDELYGLTLSIFDKSSRFEGIEIDPLNTIDVSGTGGDKIKTFNVSSAASVVLSACGVCVPKQATLAYTGSCGSADVFSALGIDIFGGQDIDQIKQSLDTLGISAFYTPMYSMYHQNRINFLNVLKKIKLSYLTPWHLVSWIYSPLDIKHRLYGVFDDKYLLPISQVFEKLGYNRALVVHGVGGIDEISNIGPTKFCEYQNGVHKEFVLLPEDLGVKTSFKEDIMVYSKEESINSFIQVLYNCDKGPKRDIVALNAGGALYVLRKVKSIKEGVLKALSAIESGAAANKLEAMACFYGSMNQLSELKRNAKVSTFSS